MKDLSLHVLDILQNSTPVGSKDISLTICDSVKQDLMSFEIKDNGWGMDAETLKRVTDPFYTSRTTRKVGLGLPLVKQNAEQTGGVFSIESQKGKGTTTRFSFVLSNIDRPPMGDLAGCFVLTIAQNENIHFVLDYTTDNGQYVFDTKEIKEALDGISLNTPEVMKLLKEMIQTNLKDIGANE